MSNRSYYPLRSHVDQAEVIVREAAERYNLSLVQVRGRQAQKGGLVYVARIEASRQALGDCIRPRHLAAALDVSPRRIRFYYRLLRRHGFAPACMRRAS